MIAKIKLYSFLLLLSFCFSQGVAQKSDNRFLIYSVDPRHTNLSFYWKDNNGNIIGSIQHLIQFVSAEHRELLFAMNGGMYKKDQSPQGLFVQNKIMVTPLDTLTGIGNFYLKPNGIFYITDNNEAIICPTEKFVMSERIKLATQSGPMLLIDGDVHPAFKKGSVNLNIRNGVGVLPDSTLIFVLSKQEINFFDFAMVFKSLKCKNALYLDGFVSRTYLPEEKWEQLDGNFGVIIGVVK